MSNMDPLHGCRSTRRAFVIDDADLDGVLVVDALYVGDVASVVVVVVVEGEEGMGTNAIALQTRNPARTRSTSQIRTV